jgi:hypothetical protein
MASSAAEGRHGSCSSMRATIATVRARLSVSATDCPAHGHGIDGWPDRRTGHGSAERPTGGPT